MFAEEEQALNLLFAKNAFLAEKWHLVSISGMAEKGGKGAHAPLPQDFGRSLKPIISQPEGKLWPPHFYMPPPPSRIFRPSYGPVSRVQAGAEGLSIPKSCQWLLMLLLLSTWIDNEIWTWNIKGFMYKA